MTSTIMQHLDELLSAVEVARGLIENRRKDADIKLEEMKSRMMARKCTGEAMFDELIERVLVFKTQFSDSMEAKNQQVTGELQESGALFEEKLDYLDAILEQVNQLQESENSSEELIGFFFANQDKIKNFIGEENEQRMMSRLRSQCDTMDHKNTALVDSQLEKYMQEIQASIAAIFDKSPATIKGKSKLFAEFEHNPKTMHLSKYVLEHAESRGKEHGDTPGRASKLRRLSSKGSLVAGSVENPYQTWNSGTPSALKSSQYLPKDTFYSGLPQGTDGRRMKQSLASGTTRAGEVLDIISNDKVHFSSNLDEFQQKIFKKLKSKKPIVAAKPCVHEETDDPLESINKKLAAFNLRQRSREMNRTFQPPSSDLRQNDWLSKRPDDLYDLPLETCTGFLESHTPNIKDLRDFRQKMRERYMKEQLAANKSRMVYCTH